MEQKITFLPFLGAFVEGDKDLIRQTSAAGGQQRVVAVDFVRLQILQVGALLQKRESCWLSWSPRVSFSRKKVKLL